MRKELKKYAGFQAYEYEEIQRKLICFLQDKIDSGLLKEGEKFPPVRELADLWNVSVFPIKMATDDLARLGYVTKIPRKGIFVAPHREKVTAIALFSNKKSVGRFNFHTFQILQNLVCMELTKSGISFELFEDYRNEPEHVQIPPLLDQAIHEGRIQLVIGFGVNTSDTWFSALPVRHICLVADTQIEEPCAEVAEELFRTGRRRPAIIAPGNASGISFLYEQLKAQKVPFRKNRTSIVPPEEYLPGDWVRIGYERTLALLKVSASTRPDALIVYPDYAALGAVMAILQLKINVPEELSLFFHRNNELPFFAPFKVHWIHSDLSEIARRIVHAATGHR